MDTLRDHYPPAKGPATGEPPPTTGGEGAPPAPSVDVHRLTEQVKESSAFLDDVFLQVGRVVVGQREMVERVLIGLLTGGHCLIEGVPGLAKTLTVKTLSQTLNATFSRIQFTPDLLPADITGTIIYNMHTGQFTQKRGPLFANLEQRRLHLGRRCSRRCRSGRSRSATRRTRCRIRSSCSRRR